MDVVRRDLLLGSLAMAGCLVVKPAFAASDNPVWHVAYKGVDAPGGLTRAQAEALRRKIISVLGPSMVNDLRVTSYNGAWIVLYDRSNVANPSDLSQAQTVATRHDQLLRGAIAMREPRATVLAQADLAAEAVEHHAHTATSATTWDIAYGNDAPQADIDRRKAQVGGMLGPVMTRVLVVVGTPDGRSRLLYPRAGDHASTAEVARHHTSLLQKYNIVAEAIPSADWEERPSTPPSPTETRPAPPEPESTPLPSPSHPSSSSDALLAMPLSSAINTYVGQWRKDGRLTSAERTAWAVHDLTSSHKLSGINDRNVLQAASMIKPWVALAYFHEVKRGRFVYGSTSRRMMERMIQISDNAATNWLIKAIGGPVRTANILQRSYPNLATDLVLVEYIPGDGRTYQNRVSADAHARLLTAIWREQVPSAGEMLRLLSLPKRDRVYDDVPEIPEGVKVYDKTGTTAMCCGDMAILVGNPGGHRLRPYVFVGVIERASRADAYTSWARSRSNLIRGVSGLVWRWLAEHPS